MGVGLESTSHELGAPLKVAVIPTVAARVVPASGNIDSAAAAAARTVALTKLFLESLLCVCVCVSARAARANYLHAMGLQTDKFAADRLRVELVAPYPDGMKNRISSTSAHDVASCTRVQFASQCKAYPDSVISQPKRDPVLTLDARQTRYAALRRSGGPRPVAAWFGRARQVYNFFDMSGHHPLSRVMPSLVLLAVCLTTLLNVAPAALARSVPAKPKTISFADAHITATPSELQTRLPSLRGSSCPAGGPINGIVSFAKAISDAKSVEDKAGAAKVEVLDSGRQEHGQRSG